MNKPVIVMQTDFGTGWGVVATMHGVCKKVDPSLEVYDSTHTLPEYDTFQASYCLQYTIPYWPEGTIFVSVVDPGVGTERKASVAKTSNGYYIVTPDNGSLTHVKDMYGIDEVREIDGVKNRYKGTEDVDIFHGRDLFAYCAAKLASGKISFEEVGEQYPVDDIITHEIRRAEVKEGSIKGILEGGGESFGNVESNIYNKEFNQAGFKHGDMLKVVIKDKDNTIFSEEVLYQKSFGFVDVGEAILFNDLASFVSIGLNQKSFADRYGITSDNTFDIVIEK